MNLNKLIKLIYSKRRTLFFLVFDILFIALSIVLAFALRFDGSIPSQYLEEGTIINVIVLALLFTLPIFYSFRLYSFSWAYVSASELISLFKAVFSSFLFLAVIFLIFKDQQFFQGFPRSTLFISYFLIFIFAGAIRFAKRIYFQMFKEKGGDRERTLIVGAGDAGEQLLRSILASRSSFYLPVGFADDNPTKQGVSIHGLNVLCRIDDIPNTVKEYQVKGLIIALPSVGSKTIKKAVEMGRRAGLRKIKIVPSMGEIINGEISVRNIREVEVEDLLGREPIGLDFKPIESFIKDKRVLITGAAGSIGSELSKQIAGFNPSNVLLLDQDETGIFNISKDLKEMFPYLKHGSLIVDIKNEMIIDRIFSKFQPNIVFHAAAYKHVPLMENQPSEAVRNNIFGTKTIAQASLKYKAEKFVFISTDKAVNPSSVMGASKRIGEMICQDLNQKKITRFVSVRFGNVLDSRGSVIPTFRKQIEKRGPIEVTHSEMKRYFMTTPEACLLVMQAGAMGQGGEVFILDMGEPVKIIDLAKEMIRLSGFEPDKDIPVVISEPRPGEKLFEEILTAEEGVVATQHQKIFMAKLSIVNEEILEHGLNRLKEAADRSDKDEIISILKTIIPFYQ